MAQQTINVGSATNDGTGDPLRTGWQKVNANFTEVYGRLPSLSLTGIVAADSGSGIYRVATLSDFSSFMNVANGLAGLGSDGKVSTSLLPASILGALVYQGLWNASANTPALASGVGTKGYYYKVSVAGTTSIDGNASWAVGDWIVFDGTTWDKIDNNEAVTAVAGLVGNISAASLKAALSISYGDISGLGTAAQKNVGTAPGNIVQLDVSTGKMPPVDGSLLTGLPYKFSKEFISAQQTITAAGTLTIAHGLGVAPKMIRRSLVCVTAEQGYSVGDVLLDETSPVLSGMNAAGVGATITYDATNIYVTYGSYTNPFVANNKGTGASGTGLTNANWKFVVAAWA